MKQTCLKYHSKCSGYALITDEYKIVQGVAIGNNPQQIKPVQIVGMFAVGKLYITNKLLLLFIFQKGIFVWQFVHYIDASEKKAVLTYSGKGDIASYQLLEKKVKSLLARELANDGTGN